MFTAISRHFASFIVFLTSFVLLSPLCFASVGDFTIYPTYQHGDNTHWIIRTATPGDNVIDFVTVENLSDEEQHIDLQVVTAHEENGSFILDENKPVKELGEWTKLSDQKVTLAPHQKKKVTFSISIPKNAPIAQYKASVLASKSFKNEQNQTIVTRLGTRIYLQLQRSYLKANIFTAPYANNLLLILGVAGVMTMAFLHYKKRTLAIAISLIAVGGLAFNTTANAQQLIVQVVGGGYRLSGPSEIVFDPVTASFSDATNEVNIRDISTDYVLVEDQNGGSEFEVQIQASGPLTKITDPGATIPLSNFLIKNVSSGGSNDIDTLNGRSDGLTLNPLLNDFYQDPPDNTIANDLSTTQVLASGSGQQPGQWKFYPTFRLTVPETTPVGIYETTLIFTII